MSPRKMASAHRLTTGRAFSNNVEGIKALCMAGCSPTDVNILGYSPFRVAASVGRVDAMRALLPYTPKEEIDLALHAAMLQGGGSAEVAVVSPTRSEPKPAIPKPCILTPRGPNKAQNLPKIQRRFEARTAARNSPEKVLYADFQKLQNQRTCPPNLNRPRPQILPTLIGKL